MSAKHDQRDEPSTHHQQAGEWPVSLECLEAREKEIGVVTHGAKGKRKYGQPKTR